MSMSVVVRCAGPMAPTSPRLVHGCGTRPLRLPAGGSHVALLSLGSAGCGDGGDSGQGDRGAEEGGDQGEDDNGY